MTAARGLAAGNPGPSVLDAAETAVGEGAAALVLSSEQLEDSLRDASALSHLETFARRRGMSLTVVLVIRDQVGALNEIYCERILRLQMARDFEAFVSSPQPAARFDYARAFAPVLGTPGLDVVTTPYLTENVEAHARSVVAAAGLRPQAVAALPVEDAQTAAPGPVKIAGTRLLFKRAWRLGLFKSLPRTRLLEAARQLSDHADEHIWDDQPFWGWTDSARDSAIERYAPGNDVLAGALWGRSWGDRWENGRYVDVDLASSAPPLVVDVMRTVDAIVKDLQRAMGAVRADVDAD